MTQSLGHRLWADSNPTNSSVWGVRLHVESFLVHMFQVRLTPSLNNSTLLITPLIRFSSPHHRHDAMPKRPFIIYTGSFSLHSFMINSFFLSRTIYFQQTNLNKGEVKPLHSRTPILQDNKSEYLKTMASLWRPSSLATATSFTSL